MPGIEGSRDRPQETRPHLDSSRVDNVDRSYDPLDHVGPRDKTRTPAPHPDGEDRALGGLVNRIRQSMQERFGEYDLPDQQLPPDAPGRVKVDRPDLPRSPATVYGRPTIIDSGGRPQVPPLFHGDPRRDQVRQGELNDCWAIAAISAAVGHRPEAVRDLVRERPDGSYEVRLHHALRHRNTGDWVPTGKRIELEISPEFPVDPREPTVAAFANIHRTGVSWVAVLEKALAGLDGTSSRGHPRRIENGYDRLDGGGTAYDTAQVLAQLTGERAGVVRIPASPGWATDLHQLVEDLLDADKPVVVGTARNHDRYSVLPYGLRGPHAYDVTQISDEGLTLRNPTGTFHPQRVSSSQLIQYLDGQLSVLR